MRGQRKSTPKASRGARHSNKKNKESTTTQPGDFLNDIDKKIAEGLAALRRSKEASAAAQTAQTHHDKKWQERQLEELKEVKESRRQTREHMAEIHKVWMGVFSRLEAEAMERPDSQPSAPRVFTHSSDYRSVTVRDENFTLTSRQAQVIQILDESRQDGHPDVGKDYLLEQLGSPNSRLRDSFKTNPRAWETLVKIGAKRATYRLNV